MLFARRGEDLSVVIEGTCYHHPKALHAQKAELNVLAFCTQHLKFTCKATVSQCQPAQRAHVSLHS